MRGDPGAIAAAISLATPAPALSEPIVSPETTIRKTLTRWTDAFNARRFNQVCGLSRATFATTTAAFPSAASRTFVPAAEIPCPSEQALHRPSADQRGHGLRRHGRRAAVWTLTIKGRGDPKAWPPKSPASTSSAASSTAPGDRALSGVRGLGQRLLDTPPQSPPHPSSPASDHLPGLPRPLGVGRIAIEAALLDALQDGHQAEEGEGQAEVPMRDSGRPIRSQYLATYCSSVGISSAARSMPPRPGNVAVGHAPLHALVGQVRERMAHRRQLPSRPQARDIFGKDHVVDAIVAVHGTGAAVVEFVRAAPPARRPPPPAARPPPPPPPPAAVAAPRPPPPPAPPPRRNAAWPARGSPRHRPWHAGRC